jgi:hypothetical protein
MAVISFAVLYPTVAQQDAELTVLTMGGGQGLTAFALSFLRARSPAAGLVTDNSLSAGYRVNQLIASGVRKPAVPRASRCPRFVRHQPKMLRRDLKRRRSRRCRPSPRGSLGLMAKGVDGVLQTISFARACFSFCCIYRS